MSKFASGRDLIAAVAGPREWSDTRQSWLNRAAKRAGLSYRTIRGIFYGEIDKPDHPCMRLLEIEAASRMASLAGRYERLARSMDAADADFFRADALALIDAARALRDGAGAVVGSDSTGNDSEV